jgi:hypothetical protein
LVLLQVYIDESGFDGGPVYVLGACVSTVSNWTTFSEEWQKILDMSPSVSYFKASEAFFNKGEFLGVSEERRREKNMLLFGAIEDNILVTISHCISKENWNSIVNKNAQARKFFRSPYSYLVYGLIPELMMDIKLSGNQSNVEFIFDDHLIEKQSVIEDWSIFMDDGWLPRRQKKQIKGAPTFRNDKAFLPLQAADMIAWISRKRWLERQGLSNEFDLPLRGRERERRPTHKHFEWTAENLEQDLDAIKWNIGFTIKAASRPSDKVGYWNV